MINIKELEKETNDIVKLQEKVYNKAQKERQKKEMDAQKVFEDFCNQYKDTFKECKTICETLEKYMNKEDIGMVLYDLTHELDDYPISFYTCFEEPRHNKYKRKVYIQINEMYNKTRYSHVLITDGKDVYIRHTDFVPRCGGYYDTSPTILNYHDVSKMLSFKKRLLFTEGDSGYPVLQEQLEIFDKYIKNFPNKIMETLKQLKGDLLKDLEK